MRDRIFLTMPILGLLLVFGIGHSTLVSAADSESEASAAGAKVVETPYSDEQKTVFEFFFNHPQKINAGLSWLRIYMNTLMDDPYGQAPEFMSVKVVSHGTEMLALLKDREEDYKEAVQRMQYYHSLGVEFIACNSFAKELGYDPSDFHEFVTLAPSAPNEVIHWQQEGYQLIVPLVHEQLISMDEMRKPAKAEPKAPKK